MYEFIPLIIATVIIAIVLFLYFREKKTLKKYHELLEEKRKIDKLSKQVQLDYYKRRLTEDTLRKVLADYHEKSRELDALIEEIENKHGIKTKKTGLERHLEKEAVSEKKEPKEDQDLGKMMGEIQ